MHICLALSKIFHLVLKQGDDGSTKVIISHKYKIREIVTYRKSHSIGKQQSRHLDLGLLMYVQC